MTDNTTDRALDWDDEISSDGPDFTTLPKGRYPFTVVDLDRERHGGSEKLSPCNKAVVHLRFDGGAQGSTTIKENLFLHSKTEGILCAFFTAIGQRNHGEKLKMDWGRVIGSSGLAELGIREYEKDGETRTINQVKKYLEPAETAQASAPAKPASYTPGAF